MSERVFAILPEHAKAISARDNMILVQETV